MLSYLHHIMFDPLSWWEHVKIDLVITAVVFAFIGVGLLFVRND